MRARFDLHALGVPGIVGLGLLLFCASFYGSAVEPAREELTRLLAEEQQIEPVTGKAEQSPLRATGLADTRGQLPPVADAPELFERLYAAGERNGLVVERATYNLTKHEKSAMQQYEVTLPLRGGYPNIRAFLREALEVAPVASLDSLSLQRSRASDPLVEASVRLSYYFALK